MTSATSLQKSKRAPRKKEPLTVTHRHFKIDDEGKDSVHTKATEKTITIHLKLNAEGGVKRKIGVVTRSTKTLVVKRKRALHLFVKGNAYGFNEYLLKEAKTFDTIRLSDEFHMWKFPVSLVLEKGKYLNFKQKGFELQLFISLEDLAPYRVYKKEGRRI